MTGPKPPPGFLWCPILLPGEVRIVFTLADHPGRSAGTVVNERIMQRVGLGDVIVARLPNRELMICGVNSDHISLN